jgi:putative acetyltransferase
MLIRTEVPADILAVDQLLRDRCDTARDADKVMSLRENRRITLALVACDEQGQIVGYSLFISVGNEDIYQGWQHLQLLVTQADVRDFSVDRALVQEGLSTLRELGYPVCTVWEQSDLYRQMGFRSAAEVRRQPDIAVDDSRGALLICELTEGAVDRYPGPEDEEFELFRCESDVL